MNNASDVAIVQSVNDLEDDLSGFDLTDFTFLLYPFVELSTCCALHYHDELFAFNKCVVKLNDVLVL